MKYSILFLLAVVNCSSITTQTETIVHDGLIGFTKEFRDDTLRVISVNRNKPAGKSGLLVGDLIVKINGHQVSGTGYTDKDINYLLNTLSNTELTFSVLRQGTDSLIVVNVLSEMNLTIEIRGYFDYLVDTSGRLTIEDISRDSWQGEFKAPSESQLANDLKKGNFWLRLKTENRISESRDYIISFINPTDTIYLYESEGEGRFNKKISGTAVNRADKDYHFKYHVLFKIRLFKDQRQTFYINIKEPVPSSDKLLFALIPFEYVRRYERFDQLLLGAIWGMMLIIAFYYMVLYIYDREKSYLYFVGYVILISLLWMLGSGFYHEILDPDDIDRLSIFDSLLVSLPFIFFLLFGISYLNLKQSQKFWFRAVKLDLWILLILTMVTTFTGLFLDEESSLQSIMMVIYSIVIISTLFILVIPAILRIRNKYRPAWHFLSANLIILFFLIFTSIYVSSDPDSNYALLILTSGLHFSLVLQFLVFALGLGQKMKTIELEKKTAQKRIIEHLRENEKLKGKVNRELEDKVRKRTREIVQQSAEIEAQRDELERQRDVLSEQKQDITDSINYAQRIQTAVLPPQTQVEEILPENFILFKPRDIVSGDFYWIRQIKNYTVIVAADCTGHGVPGAFMSMLGISFLNEIVSRSRFDSAGEFLNRLRKKVKDTLKQQGKELEQKDGMDIALSIIDNDTREMQFAGAFNPVYVIRNKKNLDGNTVSELINAESDQFALIEIKGNRQPIAIHPNEKDFDTIYFQLMKEDTIYLFSDGFADQMGGPKGKKFMTRTFKKLLLSIQDNPIAEQKNILTLILEEWMGNYQQLDDILVIGIKW